MLVDDLVRIAVEPPEEYESHTFGWLDYVLSEEMSRPGMRVAVVVESAYHDLSMLCHVVTAAKIRQEVV